MFERHLSDFEKFKERISIKLLVVCKEITQLGEMFNEFETAQKSMTKNGSIFTDRKELFDKLLKFDAFRIIAIIQKDIENVKQQLKKHNEAKEAKI
jgi:hypothetical protein